MWLIRPTYDELIIGLDQLYLLPLGEAETLDDRIIAIENYLAMSDWSMDQVIVEMAKPEVLPTLN